MFMLVYTPLSVRGALPEGSQFSLSFPKSHFYNWSLKEVLLQSGDDFFVCFVFNKFLKVPICLMSASVTYLLAYTIQSGWANIASCISTPVVTSTWVFATMQWHTAMKCCQTQLHTQIYCNPFVSVFRSNKHDRCFRRALPRLCREHKDVK